MGSVLNSLENSLTADTRLILHKRYSWKVITVCNHWRCSQFEGFLWWHFCKVPHAKLIWISQIQTLGGGGWGLHVCFTPVSEELSVDFERLSTFSSLRGLFKFKLRGACAKLWCCVSMRVVAGDMHFLLGCGPFATTEIVTIWPTVMAIPSDVT